MDAADSLRLFENALRLSIHRVLGADWPAAQGAPEQGGLEARRITEAARRDGAVTSDDLLEYAETHHLTRIVLKNWEQFQPVFRDKKRTEVYFGVVEDVRNSVAHSRHLMDFERDLLSGVAGQIRAQVARFRSERDESTLYYPLIEHLQDSFGNAGVAESQSARFTPLARVGVGEVVAFTGSAFAADGNETIWTLQQTGRSLFISTQQLEMARGDSVEFSYRFAEEDVGEAVFFGISITTPSKYHRHQGVDDIRYFHYQVSPPWPPTSRQSSDPAADISLRGDTIPLEPEQPRKPWWPRK